MLNLSPREPVETNPKVFLIYSIPKFGKSTIMANLTTDFAPGKSIILSNEPGGYDYLRAAVKEVLNPYEFNEALDEAIQMKEVEYIIVDTITKLDEWSEYLGTFNYMKKPQGKRFNLDASKGQYLKKDDPGFETVHDLPNGHGYKYSREVMVDWLQRFRASRKNVILLAHVKDKYISSIVGDTIQSIDINLTGKVKDKYCSDVDSIAMLVGKEDKRYLSFQTKSNSKFMGSRPSHLEGKILISEKLEDGTIKTYWNNIFI